MISQMHRALVGLAGIGASCFCIGWSADGHRIVAQIAADELTPTASAAVGSLLDGETMAEASLWADNVRNLPHYRWSKPLHYVNLPRDAEEFNLERDCQEDGCVVSAIADFTELLADQEASRDLKREALRFLIHFVGDIHQPLHAGYAEDRGGNDIQVRFFTRQMNLHSLWDKGLIEKRAKPWQQYAADLRGGITASQRTAWKASMTAADWATESYRLAVTHAYQAGNGDTLGQPYFDENIAIVEQQLAKGGVRLAAILNDVFPATPSQQAFVGSRRSEVYHYPQCRSVDQIHAENLVNYTSAPPGKRLHKDCPW